MSLPHSVIALLGATGVGKSQLAIDLARQFNGEVISCDSMQVYKGLDRTTNKVTTKETVGVPHHMLSCVDREAAYTVVQYRDAVLELIDAICLRGNIPILCGGTSYYAEAVLQTSLIDEEDGPPAVDPHHLAGNEQDYDFSTLLRIDPEAAVNLHPNNSRKVRRALAVYYQTGITYTQWIQRQRDRRKGRSPFRFQNTLVLWMYCDLKALDDRLDKRVDEMLKEGALEEMRAVVAAHRNEQLTRIKRERREFASDTTGPADDTTPDFTKGIWQNLGLKEMYPYLTTGEDYNVCIENMKRGTRRYARRQLTWLRGHFANYIKLPANTWAVNTTGAEKGVREHQAGELIAPGVAEECGDPLSTVSGDNSVNTTERPLENAGNRAAPWTVVHNGTVIEKGTGLGKKGPGFKDTNLGHTDEKLENGHGSESTKPDVLSSDTIQSVPVAVRHIPIESSTTTGVCAVHLNVASEPEMNVYVIDSTNTTEYTRTVLPRAMALVNMFLSEDKGRMMPHVDVERDLPEDIRESLKKASTRIADKKKRYCDTCDISVLGDDVWMSHTKGKRHKALNKRLKQNADVMSDKSETTIKS